MHSMDKRSWLWRRKSSEKSPGGETESTGSVSSHFERFFDDQVYAVHSSQSPEVISKAALNGDEDVSESVKALKDSLCAALLEINTKEDLVKQHSKVAEEAVTGWEKAENELSVCKNKLEASNQKISALEDHVGHLDQALKECVRQLRQAREDQEQKVHEAVAKKTREWESSKSVLESQLADLQEQLRSTKAEAFAAIESDLRPKLEAAEMENSTLKSELHSLALERDLSVKAAETASKQHLESKKKFAKLEAECRGLKAVIRKMSKADNPQNKSPSTIAENHSDSSERLLEVDPGSLKIEREINLMDDFLEMERLAAEPVAPDRMQSGGPNSDAALEASLRKIAELEKKLESTEKENSELRISLRDCQKRLEDTQIRFIQAELELRKRSVDADEQLEVARRDREFLESQLREVEDEIGTLIREVDSLQGEVLKERALSADNLAKCQKLQDELLSFKLEEQRQKDAELQRIENTKLIEKFRQEKELSLAAEKFAECQKTIASLGKQLKSLATLEDFMMDSEKK